MGSFELERGVGSDCTVTLLGADQKQRPIIIYNEGARETFFRSGQALS